MKIFVRKGGHPLLPYSVKEENRVNSDKQMAVWNEICKMDDKLTPLLNAKKILVKRVKRDGHDCMYFLTLPGYIRCPINNLIKVTPLITCHKDGRCARAILTSVPYDIK